MGKKWNEYIERIRSHQKSPGKNQLLLLFLCGLLLLVIVWPSSNTEKHTLPETLGMQTEKDSAGAGGDAEQEGGTTLWQGTPEEYGEYMEQRLADALQYMEGVGRAEVVITFKSSGQKVVEKDQNSSSQSSSEKDQNGGTRETTDRSSSKESVYTQDTQGAQIPYVSKELMPEIEGVLVIADGGDHAVVVQNITEAIQALFGIEAHKIKIMKRTDT